MKSQRDYFLEKLFEEAKKDKDIYIISVDLAASVLVDWQKELPEQFIYCGISEQNAINVASGLASQNKKVYIYFMAAWMCRCLEQIRYSLCMPEYSVTILGNGVGLGYAPAGPAHEPTEDISYVRSLLNIEIISPLNNNQVDKILQDTLNIKKLRYVRLERSYSKFLDKYEASSNENFDILENNISFSNKPKIALISSGYMLGRCLEVYDKAKYYQNITLINVFKIKPLNNNELAELLKTYDRIITVEEQTINGGFGSAISEYLDFYKLNIIIEKLHLPEKYIFENGTRDELLDYCDLSVEKLLSFLNT